MKKIIATLSLFCLSGCVWQTADNVDVKKAVYFCGSIDDIDEISIAAIGIDTVTCVDGSKAYLKKITVIRESK